MISASGIYLKFVHFPFKIGLIWGEGGGGGGGRGTVSEFFLSLIGS